MVVYGAQVAAARHGSDLPAPAPRLAGIAVDSAGHVYVADTRQGRIYVLSPNLQLLRVWTVSLAKGQEPVHLTGLAVDHHGMIYAADLNDRVFKLKPGHQATVQAMWGSPGRGPGQFAQPWGVAVDGLGNILVADNYNHRIQIFSPDGKPVTKWQLYSPRDFPGGPCGLQYLAVGHRGQVYVTDDCYGRVFRLSASGKVRQIWEQRDHWPGAFSGIGGVAVGPNGSVIVGETFHILKFSSTGKHLRTFSKRGYPGYPFSPTGIAIDRHGILYVVDTENFRVLKLSPSGKTLAARCLRRAGCRGAYTSSSPASTLFHHNLPARVST